MRPSKIEVKPATPENEGRAGGLRHHLRKLTSIRHKQRHRYPSVA